MKRCYVLLLFFFSWLGFCCRILVAKQYGFRMQIYYCYYFEIHFCVSVYKRHQIEREREKKKWIIHNWKNRHLLNKLPISVCVCVCKWVRPKVKKIHFVVVYLDTCVDYYIWWMNRDNCVSLHSLFNRHAASKDTHTLTLSEENACAGVALAHSSYCSYT